jgi:hypothetical protein
MIYPLTKRERLRVLQCAEDFIARIPGRERWLILDRGPQVGPHHRDRDRPVRPDGHPGYLARSKIFTVPRWALSSNEPLEDHILPANSSLLPSIWGAASR